MKISVQLNYIHINSVLFCNMTIPEMLINNVNIYIPLICVPRAMTMDDNKCFYLKKINEKVVLSSIKLHA